MPDEILIVFHRERFRLLFGHLHLANQLSLSSEVFVDVKNEGRVRITRTPHGFLVEQDAQRTMLLS